MMSEKPYVSMDKERKEAWSNDGIPCPYCGYVETEDLFDVDGAYTEDGGSNQCPECGEEYEFSTFITYSYTSYQND